MRERHGLSESSVYADLNPNNGQSTLRVWELVRVMEATGEHGPLRELANWFGYSLASAADEEPDAPTLEAEALQDHAHAARRTQRQGVQGSPGNLLPDGQGGRMNLTFSAHALDRCFERRISLQGVLDALRQGTCVKGSGMKDGERFVMAHGRLKVVAEFEGPACVVISAWRDQKGSKRAARERRQRLRRIRLAFKEGRVITC